MQVNVEILKQVQDDEKKKIPQLLAPDCGCFPNMDWLKISFFANSPYFFSKKLCVIITLCGKTEGISEIFR